jgi:hypothetical protein
MMRHDHSSAAPLLGAAGVVIALACCAGLTLGGTFLGGMTAAAPFGVASGVLASGAALAGGVLVVRALRRGRAEPKGKVNGDG